MAFDVVGAAAHKLHDRLAEADALLVVDRQGDRALGLVTAAMDECLAELSGTGLWGRANEVPSSELWKIAGHSLRRGWMQLRAREKPRGYAGDYELLGRMVRNQLCEDPLGRLLDQYFQNLAAPIAVRNRSELVRDWLVQRVRGSQQLQSVVVVGSGPAYDVEHAVLALTVAERSRLRIRLLDYDPEALESAVQRISPVLGGENLTVEAAGLFRIPIRPKMSAWLDGADFIVCVGMFDYLVDPQAARMLRTFWERAAPGGEVAVFNFSPANTSRAYMEWIGNWYLLYRDQADMRRMGESAGIDAEHLEFGSEPLGADLFLRARKPIAF